MKTKVIRISLREREKAGRAVEAAVKAVREGAVVAYPTETSYALGADATNEPAIQKVFEIKGRENAKPLPVIVSDLSMAKEYAEISPIAEVLANAFMPGPLTLVVPKKATVPDSLSKEGLAFRIPSNHFARAIASEFGKPLTATSANTSGKPSIYTESDLVSELEGKLPLIISTGDLVSTPASTMIDLRVMPPKLLREGPVPFSEVLAELKKFGLKPVGTQ